MPETPEVPAPGAPSGNLNSFGVTRTSPVERTGCGSAGSRPLRNSWIRLTVNAGLSSESVPDAVQIDSLPSLHQALRVRTVEGEMPQGWISHDVIPGRDTRYRRVHDNKALDLVRVA